MTTKLSDDQIAQLREFFSLQGPGRQLRHLRKGQTLFEKGDEANRVFFVLTGQIRVNADKNVLHEFRGPQTWLAEIALNGHRIHRHTAVATMDSDVVAFTAATFHKLCEDHPALGALYDIGIRTHLDIIKELLDDQLINTPAQRLARAFLAMFVGKDVDVLQIERTPTYLGDLIGNSRQHVYRIIKRFEAMGIIEVGPDFYLIHKGPLEEFMASGDG